MNKKTNGRIAKGRSLFVVDIENLVGSSQIDEHQVAEVRANLMDLAKPGQMDQFYVASSHHNAIATSFGWPGACYGFLSGEDGADFRIIQQLCNLAKEQNFDHVYIASGDGCMAYYAKQLLACGIQVTVISNHRSMSHELRHSGAAILWLDGAYQLAA